jgi:hypothetical protein
MWWRAIVGMCCCRRAGQVVSSVCSVLRRLGVRSNCIAVPEALGIFCRRVCAHGTTATSRVGRGRAAGPVVRVRLRLELLVNVQHAVASAVLRVTNLNVVVVPTELLIRLDAGQEVGAAEEVADAGNWELLVQIWEG